MTATRPPVPAALARRLAAARKRTEAAHEATVAPRQPRPAQQPKAPTPPAKIAKPAEAAPGAGSAGADEGEGLLLPTVSATVADRLRAMAGRPDVLAMLSDDELVAVWKAMVRGAAQAGAQGTTDRQSLFRAAGMPFTAHIGSGQAARGGPGRAGPGIGDRLERALARASGHAGVTEDEDDTAEPAENLGFAGIDEKSIERFGDRPARDEDDPDLAARHPPGNEPRDLDRDDGSPPATAH